MATVIRLKRCGRTHDPYYRVVVMDSRQRTRGREIEEVGIYHPCARPEPITEIQEDRVLEWLSKGAKPSDTLRNILSKRGIMAKFAAVKAGKAIPETADAEPETVAVEEETATAE